MTVLAKHIDKIILTLLCWLPYFIYIYHNSSGIPFNDDYDLFLKTLLDYNSAGSIKEKVLILFSQHMEHRPVIPKLIAILIWKLSGAISFKSLIVVGNIFLYLNWVLLYSIVAPKTIRKSLLYGVIIFLLLTGLQSMENMIWATGSVQNYGFVFFISFSLYLILSRRAIIGTMFWLVALLFNISAFVMIPMILFYWYSKGEWRNLWVGFMLMLFISLIYFLNFNFPPVEKFPGLIPNHSWGNKVNYFFTFISSCLTLGRHNLVLSVIMGGVLVVVLIVLNKRVGSWNYFTALAITMVFFGFMGVLFRSVFGAEQALAERYRIYSELLVICIIAQGGTWIRKGGVVVLGLACIQYISLYYYYNPKVKLRKQDLEAGYIHLVFFKNPEKLMHPSPFYAADKLIQSYEAGIYKP